MQPIPHVSAQVSRFGTGVDVPTGLHDLKNLEKVQSTPRASFNPQSFKSPNTICIIEAAPVTPQKSPPAPLKQVANSIDTERRIHQG